MKKTSAWWVLGLALCVTVSGCQKKQEPGLTTGPDGFDSLQIQEDLSQLPQVAAPADVEALPIEASPVTQAPPVTEALAPAAAIPADRDRQIQTALKLAGFYQGNVDGKIGPMTRKAIEAFQKANGLAVDGKVGPKTWAKLEAYLTGQVAPEAAR